MVLKLVHKIKGLLIFIIVYYKSNVSTLDGVFNYFEQTLFQS